MSIIHWIIGIVLVGIILYFLDREIYFYEGARMGTRVQGWLYDRWARKYDHGKAESQTRDDEMLARPLLEMLDGVDKPFILDVATGTGRLPLTVCQQADFGAQIIAMDISLGMLEIAADKLTDHHQQVTLLHYEDFPLPFPDETFDAVTCMEALEVMAEMETPLKELYRVLKPGGAFITSRGTEASGRKAKVRSTDAFTCLLNNTGFEQVEIISWWKLFDRVRARKSGDFKPSNKNTLAEVLVCPKCNITGFTENGHQFICSRCKNVLNISADHIILYQK